MGLNTAIFIRSLGASFRLIKRSRLKFVRAARRVQYRHLPQARDAIHQEPHSECFEHVYEYTVLHYSAAHNAGDSIFIKEILARVGSFSAINRGFALAEARTQALSHSAISRLKVK